MTARRRRSLTLWIAVFVALAFGFWRTMSSATLLSKGAPKQEVEHEAPRSPGDADFFAIRATYPTGHFESRWITAAAEQDRTIARGVPAGKPFDPADAPDSPLSLDSSRFTSIGPRPENIGGSWGHVGGRVNVIATDPVDSTLAYLGSVGGGVWKTTNCCSASTTWAPVTDDPLLSTISIDDITIDPNNPNTVYAGTGDLNYGSFSMGAAGILKSVDSGATWTLLGSSVFTPVYPEPPGGFPQYQAVGKVRVDPRNSSNVVAGTKTGIFISYDAGVNWSGPCYTDAFSTQRHDVTGLILRDNGSSTDIFVAIGTRGFNTTVQPDLNQNGSNGMWKATLPGSGCPASWTLLNNGWPAGTGGGVPYPTNPLGRIDIAIAPNNSNVIYAQVADANVNTRGQLGVWRTTDGGATWTERSSTSGLTGCFGDYNQNWYDQGVTIDPNNSDNVFISTVDLFRSTNGGTTFVDLTCGYAGGNVHVDHHARAFIHGSSSQLLIGSDGGVYYSANANVANPTFVQINDSLSTIEFYSGDITAGFATSGTPGANAGAQDNGSSVVTWAGNPGPALWTQRNGGDGMYARIEPKAGLRWYEESQNGNVVASTTGPNGSFSTNATGGWGSDRLSFVFPYEIDRNNCPGSICNHMIAGSYRVWESILGAIPASSWLANSPDLTKNTLADRSFINQLAYAKSDGTVAIVGTNDGNVQMGFGMGQGVANSATWVNVTGSNTVLPNRPILDVVTDPASPLTAYAAVGGFEENTPSTPGHVYRLVCTANCGSFTWTDKSGNLPDIPIDAIEVNPHVPSQVFAGSDWGLYFTDDITVASPVWQRFENGLPPVMIWDMAIDRGATTLALFTRSRGAFVWPLPTGPVNLIFYDGFESADTSRWSATFP